MIPLHSLLFTLPVNKPKIIIIGAGLQGATTALALSVRGFQVTLIEKNGRPLLGSSLRNEGKIHLGFVYALDGDGMTRQRMIEGALSFGPLIESWCGTVPWDEWRSDGFYYVVMPDSLLSAEALAQSYNDVKKRLLEFLTRSNGKAHYLGTQPSWLWKRNCSQSPMSLPIERSPQAEFETEEVSVDPRRLAEFVCTRIMSDRRITFLSGIEVKSAKRSGNGFELALHHAGQTSTVYSDIVVNCAWEDRLRLDSTIGVAPYPPQCSYRIKYQILVKPRFPARLRAITMVQGPYGDIVPWKDGTVYISWYPSGCTYFSSSPPRAGVCDDPVLAKKVATDTLSTIAEYVPDLRNADIVSAMPGIIMANGRSDVDEIDSGLHQRDKIGPRQHSGWWSVDTGKLTTAPLFAEQTAQEIEDQSR